MEHENNLALNTSKTKELIINFQKQKEEPAPLYIGGVMVEMVSKCIVSNFVQTVQDKYNTLHDKK